MPYVKTVIRLDCLICRNKDWESITALYFFAGRNGNFLICDYIVNFCIAHDGGVLHDDTVFHNSTLANLNTTE